MQPLYDSIGVDYRRYRQPDPRFQAAITAALGDSKSVVNVGAGSGSYEPAGLRVIAVEPSSVMIRQRPAGLGPVVRACATRLPLPSRSVDGALAVLTLHHWPDWAAGARELLRVARRRVVVLTFDPEGGDFWLTRDYFPEIIANDRASCPSLSELSEVLGATETIELPVPHDCSDGFLGAYWRRPEAYLSPALRGAISAFAKVTDLQTGLQRLREDLATGAWERRHGHLRALDQLDLGYRLIVAEALAL